MIQALGLQSRRVGLLVICVLAAATVAYLTLFFMPSMRAMRANLQELEERRAFILSAEKTRPLAEQLEKELAATIAYNSEHESQLVEPAELPVLYGRVSQITKSHGLTTARFEPKPAVHYESLQKVSVGLGLAGTFADVHAMLVDLEKLEARVFVEDLRIHSTGQTGKTVECDVTLAVFVDNPEKND